jgi:hypothetical protein
MPEPCLLSTGEGSGDNALGDPSIRGEFVLLGDPPLGESPFRGESPFPDWENLFIAKALPQVKLAMMIKNKSFRMALQRLIEVCFFRQF